MKIRRAAAFTLIELLISTGVASALGAILYVVATEGVTSFARNASVNRSYNEARSALDRIAGQVQSAGQTPVLVDANGTALTNASQAQGVRFYRYSTLPTYQIPSGTTADSFLTINFTKYQSAGNAQNWVQPGDLATIPLIGFQGTIVSISNYTKNADGSGSMKLNFTPAVTGSSPTLTNIGDGCVPALPTDSTTKKRIETSFVPTAKDTSKTPNTPAQYYTCLIFRQVAYIAVPNNATDATAGAQLRYYSQAMSTGAGTVTAQAGGGLASLNSTSAFNNSRNYDLVANLYGGSIVVPTGTPAVAAFQPFQLVTNNGVTTLATTICEESVDSSNRVSTSANNLGINNDFCMMRSTATSRCPSNLVR